MDKVLSDMRGCSLGVRFYEDAAHMERHHAFEVLLGLEGDPEIINGTAEADLWRESGHQIDGENADEPDGDAEEEYRACLRTVDAVDLYKHARTR